MLGKPLRLGISFFFFSLYYREQSKALERESRGVKDLTEERNQVLRVCEPEGISLVTSRDVPKEHEIEGSQATGVVALNTTWEADSSNKCPIYLLGH